MWTLEIVAGIFQEDGERDRPAGRNLTEVVALRKKFGATPAKPFQNPPVP
jgi:hypothetical protein